MMHFMTFLHKIGYECSLSVCLSLSVLSYFVVGIYHVMHSAFKQLLVQQSGSPLVLEIVAHILCCKDHAPRSTEDARFVAYGDCYMAYGRQRIKIRNHILTLNQTCKTP